MTQRFVNFDTGTPVPIPQAGFSIVDFGADPTGTTANFGTSFNAAMSALTTATFFGNFPTLYIPSGTYKIGSTVPLWKPGVNIYADQGAYIQANVSIAQMLKGGVGAANTLTDVALIGGRWDGNGLVTQDGFTIPDFNRLVLSDFRMYGCSGNAGNGSVGGFIRLSASGAAAFGDLHMRNVYMFNFGSTTPTVVTNNFGIFTDPSATGIDDCRFHNLEIVGIDIGVQGNFFDCVFVDIHTWVFGSQGSMTNGFKLTGNECRLVACQVDSPIANGKAAFDLSGASPYVLVGCGFLEGTNDNISNAVNIASGIHVRGFGNHWTGSSGAHRINTDYTGDLTGLDAQDEFTANVSTINNFGIFTATGAAFNQLTPTGTIIVNVAGTATATLLTPGLGSVPNAAKFMIKTITNNAVNSASSNVVPITGGAAGTAILAATAGKWAILQSKGAAVWEIIASN